MKEKRKRSFYPYNRQLLIEEIECRRAAPLPDAPKMSEMLTKYFPGTPEEGLSVITKISDDSKQEVNS